MKRPEMAFQTFIALMLLAATLLLPACAPAGPAAAENPAAESNRWLELLQVLPVNDQTINGAYLQALAGLEDRAVATGAPAYPLAMNVPLFGAAPGSYSDDEWR